MKTARPQAMTTRTGGAKSPSVGSAVPSGTRPDGATYTTSLGSTDPGSPCFLIPSPLPLPPFIKRPEAVFFRIHTHARRGCKCQSRNSPGGGRRRSTLGNFWSKRNLPQGGVAGGLVSGRAERVVRASGASGTASPSEEVRAGSPRRESAPGLGDARGGGGVPAGLSPSERSEWNHG